MNAHLQSLLENFYPTGGQNALRALERMSSVEPHEAQGTPWVLKALDLRNPVSALKVLQGMQEKGLRVASLEEALEVLPKAAEFHKEAVCRFLIEQCAPYLPSFSPEQAEEVWSEYAKRQKAALFPALLDAGLRVHGADAEESAVLRYAARSGCIEAVQAVLARGVDVNECTSALYGGTALHAACSSGVLPMIEFLLKQGAQPNAVDGFGNTPLYCVFYRENSLKLKRPPEEELAMAQLLIEWGARIEGPGMKDPLVGLEAKLRNAVLALVVDRDARRLDQGTASSMGVSMGRRM